MLPSQYASIWSFVTLAELKASVAASMSMSPTLLSQCSPNAVQPMPTMATRSRIPLLAMSLLLSHRTCFPEVIMHTVRRKETPEGHLQFHANFYLVGLAIGHFPFDTPAAVEVHHRRHHRRLRREGQAVNSIRRHLAAAVGERDFLHLVDRAALHANLLRGQ